MSPCNDLVYWLLRLCQKCKNAVIFGKLNFPIKILIQSFLVFSWLVNEKPMQLPDQSLSPLLST